MEQVSKYLDADGKPKFRMSYCVFMDILGFRKITIDSFEEGDYQVLFDNFYRVISTEVQNLNTYAYDEKFRPPWSVKVFTDNIVLGYPVFSVDDDIEFSNIVAAVAGYQLAMALEGFFIRGGLAVGDLFMDDITVYGPALLEAYYLESVSARDPRIVLSSRVYEAVRNYANLYPEPHKSPHNRNVLIDPDGQAYINYLEGLIYEEDNNEIVDWVGAETHKLKIERGLKAYYSDSCIWPKYYWLANYHNYFCEKYSSYKGYDKAYLVEGKLSKRHPISLLEVSNS
jgi:hypothetical protein